MNRIFLIQNGSITTDNKGGKIKSVCLLLIQNSLTKRNCFTTVYKNSILFDGYNCIFIDSDEYVFFQKAAHFYKSRLLGSLTVK